MVRRWGGSGLDQHHDGRVQGEGLYDAAHGWLSVRRTGRCGRVLRRAGRTDRKSGALPYAQDPGRCPVPAYRWPVPEGKGGKAADGSLFGGGVCSVRLYAAVFHRQKPCIPAISVETVPGDGRRAGGGSGV